MEQSTPEGSAQTTDPLPSSDDDPLPTERFHELDTLFETTSPVESASYSEDYDEIPKEHETSFNHFSHEHISPLGHHHLARLWRNG